MSALWVIGCIAAAYAFIFLTAWWANRKIARGGPGWRKGDTTEDGRG